MGSSPLPWPASPPRHFASLRQGQRSRFQGGKTTSAASRFLRTQSIKAQHSLGTCGHRTVKCAIKGSSAGGVKWLLTSPAGSTGRQAAAGYRQQTFTVQRLFLGFIRRQSGGNFLHPGHHLEAAGILTPEPDAHIGSG